MQQAKRRDVGEFMPKMRSSESLFRDVWKAWVQETDGETQRPTRK